MQESIPDNWWTRRGGASHPRRCCLSEAGKAGGLQDFFCAGTGGCPDANVSLIRRHVGGLDEEPISVDGGDTRLGTRRNRSVGRTRHIGRPLGLFAGKPCPFSLGFVGGCTYRCLRGSPVVWGGFRWKSLHRFFHSISVTGFVSLWSRLDCFVVEDHPRIGSVEGQRI